MFGLVKPQKTNEMSDNPNRVEDDYALLLLIAQGDTSAFERFYKLYFPRLFRFILRITNQPDTVEELIQETLLVVWEKPDQFNNGSKVSTWVFGIAYNKVLKAMSMQTKRIRDIDIDELVETLGESTSDPSWIREHEDWLNAALATLSPDQRAVIELTFYQGPTYQEIAKILHCPENTVKTRMFHARKKMQVFAELQELTP
jgi:RNA polymerase sigma factor (sigma-70 family)